MPLLFFLGFFVLTLVWLLWAIVWAVSLLFWPMALLIVGGLVLRRQMRLWQRATIAPADVQHGSGPVAARGNDAFRDARNGAFEGYRQETLRRLDEEQGKFREFLQRLRRSRDKKEFDAFMDGRRGRPAIAQGDTA